MVVLKSKQKVWWHQIVTFKLGIVYYYLGILKPIFSDISHKYWKTYNIGFPEIDHYLMVCVICLVCKVETLNKWCISDQSLYLEYVAHLIITQRCKYIIYPLSCWDKSRIFPLSLFCEAPTWMPRPARALWTSWVDKQAAVIQQEWLRLRVVTGGWQTASYHRCPRFARHPVLSWISLPKTKMKVNPSTSPSLKRLHL